MLRHLPIWQAVYMHADRFDITNKKLAKGVGSIQTRKVREPLSRREGVVHYIRADGVAIIENARARCFARSSVAPGGGATPGYPRRMRRDGTAPGVRGNRKQGIGHLRLLLYSFASRNLYFTFIWAIKFTRNKMTRYHSTPEGNLRSAFEANCLVHTRLGMRGSALDPCQQQ